jgi:hypothetical protein
MKRIFPILIALVFLAGCGGGGGQAGSTSKPRIPTAKTKPKLPQVNLQANVLGSTRVQDNNEEKKEIDMGGLVERIDRNLASKNITVEDIERGWYYGSDDNRKWGTPQSWIWVNDGAKSHWISLDALQKVRDIETDELCRGTGGYYVISCVERELPHCEHIPESKCRCSVNAEWVDDQGCILTDRSGEFISINSDELKQGWYFGLSNEKKLDTPSNWIWSESGKQSRWRQPANNQ